MVRRWFKKFLWLVGVLDKVILWWRCKRLGFWGFKSGDFGIDIKEDDEEFLKEGRKLVEKVVEKVVMIV